MTEDELTRYLDWWREYYALVNKANVELENVREKVAAKYSLADTDKIAQDSELLAAVEQHRTNMQDLENRKPVKGTRERALLETLAAMGTMVPQGNTIGWVPQRKDEALKAARAKYGDAFVESVVSRENTIKETLSR